MYTTTARCSGISCRSALRRFWPFVPGALCASRKCGTPQTVRVGHTAYRRMGHRANTCRKYLCFYSIIILYIILPVLNSMLIWCPSVILFIPLPCREVLFWRLSEGQSLLDVLCLSSRWTPHEHDILLYCGTAVLRTSNYHAYEGRLCLDGCIPGVRDTCEYNTRAFAVMTLLLFLAEFVCGLWSRRTTHAPPWSWYSGAFRWVPARGILFFYKGEVRGIRHYTLRLACVVLQCCCCAADVGTQNS